MERNFINKKIAFGSKTIETPEKTKRKKRKEGRRRRKKKTEKINIDFES